MKKKPVREMHPPIGKDVRTVTLPLEWFWTRLVTALVSLIKPTTLDTRRVEKHLKMEMPMEVVEELFSPFEDQEVEGLMWEETESGKRLKPNATTRLNHFYAMRMIKGKQLDKLYRLQHSDVKKGKKDTQHKRGMGAGRLHLSKAAARKGQVSCLLAMVCGESRIRVTQPRDWRKMPVLRIRLMTMSMDGGGNIILPCEFTCPKYRAALRLQANALLQTMSKDDDYPTGTLSSFVPALQIKIGSTPDQCLQQVVPPRPPPQCPRLTITQRELTEE